MAWTIWEEIMRIWLCLIGALVALPSAVLMISQLFWLMDIHWLQHASMHSRVEFSLLTVLAAVAIYGGLKCMDVARRMGGAPAVNLVILYVYHWAVPSGRRPGSRPDPTRPDQAQKRAARRPPRPRPDGVMSSRKNSRSPHTLRGHIRPSLQYRGSVL